jgi:hypothetical protein
MIQVILGILIVGFGMGGVEHSETDLELFYASLVAAFGLLVMWAGVPVVKEQ